MNVGDIDWLQLLAGVIAGIAVIKYAEPIAENLQYWPIIHLARDSNNPFVYKALGIAIILLSVIFFVLIPLVFYGYITY